MRKYNGDSLVEIICNKCGDGVDVSNDEHGFDAEPFREFDLVYGYGSRLYDFGGVRFDLCEYCVEDFVETFAIPAESRDYEMMQAWTSNGTPFVYLAHTNEDPLSQEEMDGMCEDMRKADEEEGDIKCTE